VLLPLPSRESRALHPITCRPDQVRTAAAALLVDQRARLGVRRLQREMAQMPGVDAVVPVLEELARDQAG